MDPSASPRVDCPDEPDRTAIQFERSGEQDQPERNTNSPIRKIIIDFEANDISGVLNGSEKLTFKQESYVSIPVSAIKGSGGEVMVEGESRAAGSITLRILAEISEVDDSEMPKIQHTTCRQRDMQNDIVGFDLVEGRMVAKCCQSLLPVAGKLTTNSAGPRDESVTSKDPRSDGQPMAMTGLFADQLAPDRPGCVQVAASPEADVQRGLMYSGRACLMNVGQRICEFDYANSCVSPQLRVAHEGQMLKSYPRLESELSLRIGHTDPTSRMNYEEAMTMDTDKGVSSASHSDTFYSIENILTQEKRTPNGARPPSQPSSIKPNPDLLSAPKNNHFTIPLVRADEQMSTSPLDQFNGPNQLLGQQTNLFGLSPRLKENETSMPEEPECPQMHTSLSTRSLFNEPLYQKGSKLSCVLPSRSDGSFNPEMLAIKQEPAKYEIQFDSEGYNEVVTEPRQQDNAKGYSEIQKNSYRRRRLIRSNMEPSQQSLLLKAINQSRPQCSEKSCKIVPASENRGTQSAEFISGSYIPDWSVCDSKDLSGPDLGVSCTTAKPPPPGSPSMPTVPPKESYQHHHHHHHHHHHKHRTRGRSCHRTMEHRPSAEAVGAWESEYWAKGHLSHQHRHHHNRHHRRHGQHKHGTCDCKSDSLKAYPSRSHRVSSSCGLTCSGHEAPVQPVSHSCAPSREKNTSLILDDALFVLDVLFSRLNMLRSLVGLLDEGVKGSQTDKHGPDTYRLHAEHANRTEDNFHSRGTVGVAEACYDASVNLERGIRSNAVIINTLDGGGYTRGERNRSFLDQIERKLCEINRIVDEATVEMTDTLKQQTNPTILHKKCRQESAVNGSTGEVKIAPKEVSVHNDIVQHKLNVIFRLEKELSSLIHELRRKHNEHGISPLLPKLASTVSNLSNFSTDALAVKAPNYRVPLFAENLSYSPKVINEAVGVHHTFRLEKGISSDANPKPEIGFGIERTPTPMFRSFSSHESNQLSSSTQIDTEPIVAFGLADNRLEVDKNESSDKKAIPVLVEPHKRDEEGEREDKIKIVSEAGLNLTDSSTMAQKCRPDSNSNSILSEILRLPSLRHISFDVSMAEPEMRESFRIVQPFVCPDASDSLQRDFSVLKRLTSQEYSDNAIMITTLDLVDQVLANVSCDMLAMLDSFASLTFSVSTKEINPPSLTYRPTVETIETEPPDLEVRVIGPDVLPISECNATAHGLTQPLLLDSQNEASPRISETLDLCPRLSSDSLSTVKPEEEKSSSESRDTEESPQTSNKESCKSSGEYSNEEKSEVEHESDKMTVSNVPSLNTSGFIARNGGYNEREVEEYSNKRIKALPQIDKYLPQYSIELSPSDDTTSASSITSSPNK